MSKDANAHFATKRMGRHPGDVLDYTFSGADWLADGETISSATVSVVSGDVVIDESPAVDVNPTNVVAWISGGTPGVSIVKCVAVTTDGRTDTAVFIFDIRDR